MNHHSELSAETLSKWNTNPAHSPGDGGQGYFSYEIIDEPMPDPVFDAMDQSDQDRIAEFVERFETGDRQTFVGELELLVHEFPQFPKLYNFLAVSYAAARRHDDCQRLTRETYERFPDYLFGIINMAQLALDEGRLDDVPALFRYTMLMHELFDGRREYHISEMTAWWAFFGRYFIETGDFEVASRQLDVLMEINPDHPLTLNLERRMLMAMMASLPANLAKFGLGLAPRKKGATTKARSTTKNKKSHSAKRRKR